MSNPCELTQNKVVTYKDFDGSDVCTDCGYLVSSHNLTQPTPKKTCLNIDCPERTGGECNAPVFHSNVYPPSKEDDELDTLLDNHAALYAETTMQFITGEITEDERDKEWHHSDLKTKHSLLKLKLQWQLDALEAVKKSGKQWVELNEGTKHELYKRITELKKLKKGNR